MIDFPPFRLDPTDERLWRGGAPVELRPKALEVLRFLLERPARLVTRDELLNAVWPELAVAPETLTQVIAELRRALGDDARQPAFIETVHRRGFRFVGRVAARPALRAPRSRGLLVGREAELARLGKFLGEARAGRRQIAFVTGESGIGKTSLVRTFLERVAEAETGEPVWIATGKCAELHGEGEAYLPVLDALDRLAREAGAQPVRRCLSRFAPSWLAQLPWLARPDEANVIEGTTFGTTPTRMLREFCVAVEALSEERTLVLWLEDLHWSDASTVDLLSALASRSDPARLLVLASYRPVDAAAGSHPVAPLKRSLRADGLCEELKIGPLDEASVRALLKEHLAAEPDPALARLVHEQTDGHPLFAVTLIDHLRSEQLLEETRTGWKSSTSLEALREAVPDSLAALVKTRLDRLHPEELEVLQAGSAIGTTFAAQAVAAATGWKVEAVEKVCGRLAGWGRFLESAGASSWPDGSAGERYGFLHAAFRHVIYRRLPAGRRRRLHMRIGERLEEGFASQSIAMAAELALHWERGGDLARATEHLAAAAAGVRQRSGDREAVAYFERALALVATLPESADRDRRELELRMSLWKEVNASAAVSLTEQNASLERSLELCDRTGNALSRSYVSSFRTRSLLIAGELDAAEAVDEARLTRTATLGDPVLIAAAHGEVGEIAFHRGELDRAQSELTLCVTALEGVEPQEPTRRLGHDPSTVATGRLGWLHWLQGRPDEARRDAAACLARAEATRHPLNIAIAVVIALLVDVFRRDSEAVAAMAKSYVEYADEYGFDLPYPAVYAEQSGPLVQSGEIGVAIAQLRQGVAISCRVGVREESSHLLATLAEAELCRGCSKEGLAAIEEAHAFVEETGERFWEAEIRRLEGELRRLGGEDGPAEACFEKALEVARAQGALSLELRAATSLARLWQDQGREPEARPLLAAVYGRFSEGFDTADLADAKSLLDSL